AAQIGWPDVETEGGDTLTLEDVVDEGAASGPVEEIALEEATIQGDPDLDMLDSAFEGLTGDPGPADLSEEAVEAPPAGMAEEAGPYAEPFPDAQAISDDADRALGGLGGTSSEADAARTDSHGAGSAPGSALEVRALRAQLSSLKKTLSEAQSRQNDAEDRVRELEAQLESRHAELEAIASTSGKGDKEFFALREALNRKEKDILLLTTELKDKETEMVELREHEVQLEQQVSEAAVELARRDAQIKALTGRTDNFASDRKKLQEELNDARNRLQASESEAEEMRSMIAQLETGTQEAQIEVQQLRGQVDELQQSLATAQQDSESQAKRIQEMEELATKHEARITKLYQRIKGEEKVRDKTKKALSIALHLLEEQTGADEEDEPAAA